MKRTIREFRERIEQLPSDPPQDHPGKWYRTQKEHWLGWLAEYEGPGAYGRTGTGARDARYAYNYIVEPKMLTWLIEASGAAPEKLEAMRQAAEDGATMMQQAGAVRKLVPWEVLAERLWDTGG